MLVSLNRLLVGRGQAWVKPGHPAVQLAIQGGKAQGLTICEKPNLPLIWL